MLLDGTEETDELFTCLTVELQLLALVLGAVEGLAFWWLPMA